MCWLAFHFVAYNVTNKKIEKVRIYRCESGKVYTKPKHRACGFNLIDGKKYWYCFIIKKGD